MGVDFKAMSYPSLNLYFVDKQAQLRGIYAFSQCEDHETHPILVRNHLPPISLVWSGK